MSSNTLSSGTRTERILAKYFEASLFDDLVNGLVGVLIEKLLENRSVDVETMIKICADFKQRCVDHGVDERDGYKLAAVIQYFFMITIPDKYPTFIVDFNKTNKLPPNLCAFMRLWKTVIENKNNRLDFKHYVMTFMAIVDDYTKNAKYDLVNFACNDCMEFYRIITNKNIKTDRD
jgi:hypothetical protein